MLNQYYVPDVASTGHLLGELAVELAEQGKDVTVITCRPSYGPKATWKPAPRRERSSNEHGGSVDVLRMNVTRFSKDNIVGRMVNIVTFMLPLMLRMLFSSKNRVYLYTTNPPFLGVIGAFVSLFRKHKYVLLLHDAYPQIAVLLGKFKKDSLIDKVWHRMNRMIYKRAAQSIVLCKKAKVLVCETYDIDPDRVHVIPNWANGKKLYPIDKATSPFAQAHELIEPFTVMYSGNLGLYYDFETILEAAAILKGEPFKFVFIGSGGKRTWIDEQIKERELTNCSLHQYQPFETLNESLNACDASFVTIAEGIEGISYPSKLYSSLAVGKAIIAISEPDSELRSLVDDEQMGKWFELGDGAGLAEGMRAMAADPEATASEGANARRAFEAGYTLQVSAKRYAAVMERAGMPRSRS